MLRRKFMRFNSSKASIFLLVLFGIPNFAFAQWVHYPAAGVPRKNGNVNDINETLQSLREVGARIVSSNQKPVRMTLGTNPWRLAVAGDKSNLFLVVQQRLAP